MSAGSPPRHSPASLHLAYAEGPLSSCWCCGWQQADCNAAAEQQRQRQRQPAGHGDGGPAGAPSLARLGGTAAGARRRGHQKASWLMEVRVGEG